LRCCRDVGWELKVRSPSIALFKTHTHTHTLTRTHTHTHTQPPSLQQATADGAPAGRAWAHLISPTQRSKDNGLSSYPIQNLEGGMGATTKTEAETEAEADGRVRAPISSPPPLTNQIKTTNRTRGEGGPVQGGRTMWPNGRAGS
jgi:hypothetical protein